MSSDDRSTWCRQIGSPLFAAQLQAPLSGALLQQCSQKDLFLITGSCDREAAVAGASVEDTSQSGRSAVAHLSSGVSIDLQQVNGRWLVRDISGEATHARRVASGPCAGA